MNNLHCMSLLNHLSLFQICVATFLFVISSVGLFFMLKLSIKNKWFDIPIERSSHFRVVPRTAGIVIAILSLITMFILGPISFKAPLIIGTYCIFLVIGIYDDIKHLNASKKFWAQFLISISLALFLPDFRINNFYGILGLHGIPEVVSIIFSAFVYIVVINAYNLIDGIDGLALSFSIFAIYLLSSAFQDINNQLAFFGLLLIAILVPFYFFNFSKKRKMFLGDTGSLFLGTTIVLMVGYLLNSNHTAVIPCGMNRAIYALVALCYPLLDTLRVFVLRLTRGQSPFLADRSHLHHKLLDLGFNHYSATLSLVTFNLVIYFINCAYLKQIDANAVLVVDFILIGFFFVGGLWFTRLKRTSQQT